jgi:glycosyltransferase involved in cell wall biosynthesis
MSCQVSFIIPIYNEEENIHRLSERIQKVAGEIGLTYELLFVNDGSRDRSVELIRAMAKQNPAVRYINFSRNFGHQVAVSAGLDHCKGEYIVIIDADLQDPPELIKEMYARMQEGFEVVYAKRRSRAGESFMKKYTARTFYRILSAITSIDIPLDTGDFRMIHRKVVEVLRHMPEQQKFLRGQISWAGFRQTYVEYDRDERHAGETGYTYKKMIRFALDGITSFSNMPLKFATMLGFLVSFISFILSLWALYSHFISKNYVQGWTSLMLVVLFIGGVQLVCIGIIGEYISRLSANVRNRPLYIIDDSNIETENIPVR